MMSRSTFQSRSVRAEKLEHHNFLTKIQILGKLNKFSAGGKVTISRHKAVHTFLVNMLGCSASQISSQKEPFPRSEFTLALNLDILDAGRLPNAVRDNAGTAQVDFEFDRPPFDHHGKGAVIFYEKEFRKMKKSETFSSLS